MPCRACHGYINVINSRDKLNTAPWKRWRKQDLKSASLSISHRLNNLCEQKFRGIVGDFNGNIIDEYDYGRKELELLYQFTTCATRSCKLRRDRDNILKLGFHKLILKLSLTVIELIFWYLMLRTPIFNSQRTGLLVTDYVRLLIKLCLIELFLRYSWKKRPKCIWKIISWIW